MKNTLVWALLGGACLYGTVSQAASYEEIVVTGTRTPVEAGRLPAAVTVLNRRDIEELQVNSLPELLQGIAGIDVTVGGGYGKVTGVRMRGSESDHVLVLIDGVRVGSATAGIAAFEYLPPVQVERIEIVRGPRSSLWGSEALGGVIHIFTRKGSGAAPRYSLDVGGGSFETFEVTGGVSGEYRDFNYSAAASWFDSGGINTRQPVPGPFGFDHPDKDGYDNVSVHLRGGYSFAGTGEVDVFVLRAEGATEFDGNFQDESGFVQQVAGGSLLLMPMDNWKTQLRLSEARDELESFAPAGASVSRFDTRRRQLSWQNDIALADEHGVTLGLDYRDDRVDSTTDYDRSTRDSLGIFGQYDANFYGQQLLASVRWDDDEAFGGKTTGSVGWSYNWKQWLKLYATYGTAYKTPTFNDLFYPGFSNPNLEPETAVSYEAGLEGRHDAVWWSVRAYRTDVDDIIVFACDPVTFRCAPENVNEARTTGIEGELSLRWNSWNALLGVEYLDPEDRISGNRLPRLAKKRLTFDLRRDAGRFTFGGRLFAEGDRFDDAGNRVRVNGFVTIDLSGEYRLNDRLTLRAKVANLLDEEYQTINTYNSFDRNFFLSFHYRSR